MTKEEVLKSILEQDPSLFRDLPGLQGLIERVYDIAYEAATLDVRGNDPEIAKSVTMLRALRDDL